VDCEREQFGISGFVRGRHDIQQRRIAELIVDPNNC
jgi:hypothetical protein